MRKKIELMGLAEIAKFIGVSKQAIVNWNRRGHMPKPYAQLSMGSVWTKRDIEKLKQRRG